MASDERVAEEAVESLSLHGDALEIACIEEVAFRMGFISFSQVQQLAEPLRASASIVGEVSRV